MAFCSRGCRGMSAALHRATRSKCRRATVVNITNARAVRGRSLAHTAVLVPVRSMHQSGLLNTVSRCCFILPVALCRRVLTRPSPPPDCPCSPLGPFHGPFQTSIPHAERWMLASP